MDIFLHFLYEFLFVLGAITLPIVLIRLLVESIGRYQDRGMRKAQLQRGRRYHDRGGYP